MAACRADMLSFSQIDGLVCGLYFQSHFDNDLMATQRNNVMSFNVFLDRMPFEGQLKQKPSSLVFKGTKYSQYPNYSLACGSIFFFLLLIVRRLLGTQTC